MLGTCVITIIIAAVGMAIAAFAVRYAENRRLLAETQRSLSVAHRTIQEQEQTIKDLASGEVNRPLAQALERASHLKEALCAAEARLQKEAADHKQYLRQQAADYQRQLTNYHSKFAEEQRSQ